MITKHIVRHLVETTLSEEALFGEAQQLLETCDAAQTCVSVEEGIERYLGDLNRRARGLSRNVEEARDLVQDTVERALRFKHTYRPETHARAWLMRVMFNLFITKRRRRQTERRVLEGARVDPNGWTARVTRAPELGLGRPVRRAIAEMPDKLAEIVQLVDLFDYSYQEAASFQHVPIGTVMSRLHRGRSRLAAKLSSAARAPSQVAA